VDDGDTSVDGPSRYAAGLPRVGARRLALAEIAGLRRSWRRARLVDAVQLFALVATAGLGAAIVTGLVPALAREIGGVTGAFVALLGLGGALSGLPRLSRVARVLVVLLLVAGVAVSIAWAPGALASDDRTVWSWLRAPWIALVLVGNGVLALQVWLRVRLLLRARNIAIDLREATVEVYTGQVGTGANADELRRLWRASGRIEGRLVADAPAKLEVLPRSGVAISCCARALRRFQTVHVAEVAPARPHAFRTSLPQGVIQVRSPARLQLQRRSLTPDESAEITAHIRSLRRRIWPAVAATIAVVLVVGVRLWLAQSRGAVAVAEALLDAVALGWYALAIVAYVAYARRIVAARKLEFDRALRWVVTVDDPQGGGDAGPKLEVLPVSHLAWTENAAPASWRLCRL
jgi:hypothetical protein